MAIYREKANFTPGSMPRFTGSGLSYLTKRSPKQQFEMVDINNLSGVLTL